MACSSLEIAIVGAGTAGPAAAIFLSRAGHRVRLFERAPVNLPVGAGFLLQPTGMRVLAELGLLEALLPQTQVIRRLHCLDRRERALLDLHYTDVAEGLHGAGTHRATLLNLLLGAAEAGGASVQWNRPITRLERDADGRCRLIDAQGGEEGPFDLVLLCDGAQSALRAQSGIPCKATRYPWGALWFIGRRPPELAAHTLWQRVGSTRELVGFLPTGTKDDLVSLFWSIRLDRVAAWREGNLDTWKREVLALAPQAAGLLDQIASPAQLSVAAYHDVRMRRWNNDRVAVLGDAGHALSPQLGQGVNLALMDAAELAKALREESLLEAALNRYSARRKAHLGFYQLATRWLTPLFQSDATALGRMRDVALPLAQRIPWIRRQMILTMAGYKTGVFGCQR
jgi:2-polyprenyl-6-methoxyphenol hydroxylase-like FAD-dependent oxidoreductase